MLIITPSTVEIDDVTMSRDELALIRPSFPMPGFRRIEYDGVRHVTWTTDTQAGGPTPWAVGDALIAEKAVIAVELEALRNPPPTLEDMKSAKKTDINAYRDEQITLGMDYPFPDGQPGTVDLSEQADFRNIQARVTVAQELRQNGVVAAVMHFRDKAEVDHVLTPQQMINLGLAVNAWIDLRYTRAHELRDQAMNAASIVELDAIDIMAGWP